MGKLIRMVPAGAVVPSGSGAGLVRKYGSPSLDLSYDRTYTLGVNLLPNPDEVLNNYSRGQGIRFYRQLRQQLPFVAGICKLRIDQALTLPHTWQPGDPNDVESLAATIAIAQAWDSIPDRDSALRKLMFSIFDGFAVAEYVWGTVWVNVKIATPAPPAGPIDPNAPPAPPPLPGSKVLQRQVILQCPVRIIDRRTWLFHWDPEEQLRFRSIGAPFEGEVVDPLQYVVSRYGSAEPYGEGELRDVYADAWKIDTIDKFALEALERQGYPMALILVPEQWKIEQMQKVRASVRATYKNFMMIPLGDRFEVSFPSQTAPSTFLGADQISRISKLQDNISIALIGIAFSNEQSGGRARDAVRAQKMFEKSGADAQVYDSVANDWKDKVCRANYENLHPSLWPRMVTDSKPKEDLDSWMTNLTAAVAMGFPGSIRQVAEKQGFEVAEDDADRLTKAVAPAPMPGKAPADGSAGGTGDGGLGSTSFKESPFDQFDATRPIKVMIGDGDEICSFRTLQEFREVTGL